jgi:hypothetical protein
MFPSPIEAKENLLHGSVASKTGATGFGNLVPPSLPDKRDTETD